MSHTSDPTGESSLAPRPGQRRGLCCDCGEVRFVKATYHGRGFIAEDMSDPERGRFLAKLKCGNCQADTKHALIRDFDKYANRAEQRS
jgi:hypothetical protein